MRPALFASATASRGATWSPNLEAQPSGREVVLLGPSRGALDDLMRSIVVKMDALFGLHRKTLAGWSVELSAPKLADEGAARSRLRSRGDRPHRRTLLAEIQREDVATLRAWLAKRRSASRPVVLTPP